MKAGILSIGTELLLGETENTNTYYLSKELNSMGIDVMYHFSVGDNPGRLRELLQYGFKGCDIIITTGGLGPTQDDLTKETIAEFFSVPLIRNKQALEEIENRFKTMNRPMTENNVKQADLPQGSDILLNSRGTAPGFFLSKGGKYIVSLPGPPREMTNMFQKEAKVHLEKLADAPIYYRDVRMFGIGESALETRLLKYIDGQTDPTLATYAKEGEALLRVGSKRNNRKDAEKAVEETIKLVEKELGRYIYSTKGEEFYEVVGRKLVERGISLSSAESCTGGLFASTIVDYPGISQSFSQGVVTYSNEAKIKQLRVSEKTLNKYGAVSENTAMEMAKGLQMLTESNLCISVTGIAGPDGGSEEKPVGLAYIGLMYKDKDRELKRVKMVKTNRNNRHWNRKYTALYMLDFINKILDEVWES